MILPPCPSCGATFSADVWLSNHEARLFIVELSKAPVEVIAKIPAYLAFFRRPNGGTVTWSRVFHLTQELTTLVKSGRVETGGGARTTTPSLWGKGIDQLIGQRDKIEIPLTNHNYLRAIVYELADKADATTERRREEQRRHGADRKEEAQPFHPPLAERPATSPVTNRTPTTETSRQVNPVGLLVVKLIKAKLNDRIDKATHDRLFAALQEIQQLSAPPPGADPTPTQQPDPAICPTCPYRQDSVIPLHPDQPTPLFLLIFNENATSTSQNAFSTLLTRSICC